MSYGLKYTIEVYEDDAIIRGNLTIEALELIISLCKDEGFIYMTNIGDGTKGFKLVKDELGQDKS